MLYYPKVVAVWFLSQGISSRTKENGTVLSFVNHPQTLTVPCDTPSEVEVFPVTHRACYRAK